jgi:hypothetical protein
MYSDATANEENLLGYWKFDEEELIDHSANGNNGQLLNESSLTSNGVSKNIKVHTGSVA